MTRRVKVFPRYDNTKMMDRRIPTPSSKRRPRKSPGSPATRELGACMEGNCRTLPQPKGSQRIGDRGGTSRSLDQIHPSASRYSSVIIFSCHVREITIHRQVGRVVPCICYTWRRPLRTAKDNAMCNNDSRNLHRCVSKCLGPAISGRDRCGGGAAASRFHTWSETFFPRGTRNPLGHCSLFLLPKRSCLASASDPARAPLLLHHPFLQLRIVHCAVPYGVRLWKMGSCCAQVRLTDTTGRRCVH